MAVLQKGRLKKKITGGRYTHVKGKRLSQMGRLPILTKVGDHKTKVVKTKGNGRKMKVLSSQYANVLDPKTKKYSKSPVKSVEECPANRHFVRRNIIVKGTVIETESGKARVTSIPGQSGTVNAVLI